MLFWIDWVIEMACFATVLSKGGVTEIINP